MSDQFPVAKNTPMLTVAGVIEWLSGEVEDLQAAHVIEQDAELKNIIKGQWLYVELLIAKVSETAMRALDGDETAGRRHRP